MLNTHVVNVVLQQQHGDKLICLLHLVIIITITTFIVIIHLTNYGLQQQTNFAFIT